MHFKKVTLTMPETLYKAASRLVKTGLFANISDLVRAGIRTKLREYYPLTRDWIGTITKDTRKTGESEENIIGELRKTREDIWREKYANRFGL